MVPVFFPEDLDDFAADFTDFVFFAEVFLAPVDLPFGVGVTAHTARAVQSASVITYAVERKRLFLDLLSDPEGFPKDKGPEAFVPLPAVPLRCGRGRSSE